MAKHPIKFIGFDQIYLALTISPLLMTKAFSSLIKKHRVADFSNVFVFCLFALLVDGCATPR